MAAKKKVASKLPTLASATPAERELLRNLLREMRHVVACDELLAVFIDVDAMVAGGCGARLFYLRSPRGASHEVLGRLRAKRRHAPTIVPGTR